MSFSSFISCLSSSTSTVPLANSCALNGAPQRPQYLCPGVFSAPQRAQIIGANFGFIVSMGLPA
jgi:hypothetical protein